MAHILVVDDDKSVRDFMALVLNTEGFEVTTAVDGEDALRKIAARRPDLVLLDLMMPVLDGYGVLEKLRSQNAPVVVIVSAKGASTAEAVRAGAFDALPKPLALADLLATCRRALDSRPPRAGSRS